jgi:hypothetical protein
MGQEDPYTIGQVDKWTSGQRDKRQKAKLSLKSNAKEGEERERGKRKVILPLQVTILRGE